MKNYQVSIIIANFNTKDVTLRCIKTIIEKTPIAKEIIIIDNGSSDGSVLEFKKLKVDSKNTSIVIVQNVKNLGFAKAVNQGIKRASSEYILLLNSDVFVQGSAISKMLNFAQKTNDCGVVGGKLILGNGNTQDSVMCFPTLIGAIKEYWFGIKGSYLFGFPPLKTQKVDAVVGAAFLITPEALKKVGLMNENYFMYFEDLDYCQRTNKMNLATYYYPEAVFVHLHGASGKKLADTKNQWRRLVPSSKIYHGTLVHYLITLVIWVSQKLKH